MRETSASTEPKKPLTHAVLCVLVCPPVVGRDIGVDVVSFDTSKSKQVEHVAAEVLNAHFRQTKLHLTLEAFV